MSRCRVTIVQFSLDAVDPRRNLERLKRDIRENAESDLIVFPELALHGHEWVADHQEDPQALRAADAGMMAEIDSVVAECGTNVIYGGLLARDGKLHNVATFTNGRTRTSYAKSHVHWSEKFQPGTEFPVVREFARPLGMLICFDAAFAEVPRLLALHGAEIIVNLSAIPAAFPLKHVHRRLVACSVQNQVFTIFANRAGSGFLGGSAIVDPQGEIVALAGETGPLLVDIDLDDVRRWREEEPLFAHRRPPLYTELAR